MSFDIHQVLHLIMFFFRQNVRVSYDIELVH